MHTEFHPSSIRWTSDPAGFEGFRVLVRELPDEDECGTGSRGFPFFSFGCRPVREKGRTTLAFRESPERSITMNRIALLIPPEKPCEIAWTHAAGKIVTCEAHPRFVEEARRLTGGLETAFGLMPGTRFIINRRVDLLCQLLMQEVECSCPSGQSYFEHVAKALMVAVILQTDPGLPDAGNAEAQERRIRRATDLMEANFASRLTRDEIAAAAGLSAFHFSRLFHRIVGLAPHQYLMRCRLHHARKLLSMQEEERSIADVAAESGFADQAHLARHFRRVFDVSPQQFRRAHK